jgi:hypothetical protein
MQPIMQIARGATVFMARNLTTKAPEIKAYQRPKSLMHWPVIFSACAANVS